MPLLFNEEELMLQESTRDFIANEAPVSHLRGLRDERDSNGLSFALWKQFAHLGYAGLLVPGRLGGIGLGPVEAAIIQEQIGRCLVPTPFLSTSILAASALQICGTETQQRLYCSSIARGDELFAFAVDEQTKHQPEAIALRAAAQRDHYTLSGVKTYVLDGHIANQLIVVARTAGRPGDTAGLTLFVIPASAPGVRVERLATVDSHNAATVSFDCVPAHTSAVLGAPNAGWPALAATLDLGRNAIAAELYGIAVEVFERTLAYLKEREQFGRKIGTYQGLQHRAARLFGEIEQLRATLIKSSQMLQMQSPDAPSFVAITKSKAGRVAKLCTEEAIQMHGGIGLTDELDLGLFLKRARVLNELFGDHRFHADRLAGMNGY